MILAFDADDTLWVNEPYFREAEDKFCALLQDFLPIHTVGQELFKTEMANLALYGYGVKGFMLSCMETLVKVAGPLATPLMFERSLEIGKELLNKPVELLPGVEDVLKKVHPHYKLVVATKGDLLDQERKLRKSGIEKYFHHVEVMSDKKETEYRRLIRRLDIPPDQFLMIGNSIKSDILPVLEVGGKAVHVPYHITWAHEVVSEPVNYEGFKTLESIAELPDFLGL